MSLFSTVLSAVAPEVVSRAATYVYDKVGIGDLNLLGKPISSYVDSRSLVGRTAKGITQTAIEAKLLPNFDAMPKQTGIPIGLGQTKIGPPSQGLETMARGQNMLYTGGTGIIEKHMTKNNTKNFFISKITPNSVVKFNRANRRIKQGPVSLELKSLKRGQIERGL